MQVELEGITAGSYTIQPFDTWQGIYLDAINIECSGDGACTVPLPDFTSDMAFKIVRN
jgi:hypothetical protein